MGSTLAVQDVERRSNGPVAAAHGGSVVLSVRTVQMPAPRRADSPGVRPPAVWIARRFSFCLRTEPKTVIISPAIVAARW
jgi:hypothetical protein